MLHRLAILVLVASALPSLSMAALVDIDGNEHVAPDESGAQTTVIYFITHDCPISNRLMPEIRRICDEYSIRETRCLMAYVDPTLTAEQIREHQRAYGITEPAVHDKDHLLVELAGASVTPEAAVFNSSGSVAYRGRINNLYASLGTPRRRPTEHDLRDALDQVLVGNAVSQPRTQAVGCFIPTVKTAHK